MGRKVGGAAGLLLAALALFWPAPVWTEDAQVFPNVSRKAALIKVQAQPHLRHRQ